MGQIEEGIRPVLEALHFPNQTDHPAARAAFRCVFPPLSEGYDLGFRLARSAPAEEP